jgi:hypothetical protein
MRYIYAHASLVLIWLGELTSVSHDICELIMGLEALYSSNNFDVNNAVALHQNLTESEWDGLKEFYRNPWFTRVWVFQEVVVARRLLFVLGNFSASWDDIMTVTHVLGSFSNPMNLDESARRSGIQLKIMERERLASSPSANADDDSFGSGYALAYYVDRSRHLGATDPRDLIFALHGLSSCRNQREFVVDYTVDVREVYTRFAKYEILHRRDLHILSCATVNTNLHLPSWVPDWTAPFPEDKPMVSDLGFSLFVHAGGLPGEVEARVSDDNTTLFVMGALFTRPRVVGPIFTRTSPVSSDMEAAQGEAVFQAISDWYQTNWAIAQGAPEPYAADLSRTEAFLRCLVLETMNYSHKMQGSRNPTITGGLEFLARYSVLGSKPEATDEVVERIHAFGQYTFRDRCFCLMENGNFGWVPQATLENDVIAKLQGGKIMYVLRPAGPERYRLVGECYVQGPRAPSQEVIRELALV